MGKRGAVVLRKDIRPNFDEVVRAHAHELTIISAVVQRTQRESIGYERLTQWVSVRHDMGCVQQLPMTKLTECALVSVSSEDALAERALVETYPHLRCSVASRKRIGLVRHPPIGGFQEQGLGRLHVNRDCKVCGVVCHNEHRPCG